MTTTNELIDALRKADPKGGMEVASGMSGIELLSKPLIRGPHKGAQVILATVAIEGW